MKFVCVITMILLLSIPHTKSMKPRNNKSMGQSIANLANKAKECGRLTFIFFIIINYSNYSLLSSISYKLSLYNVNISNKNFINVFCHLHVFVNKILIRN